MRRYDYFDIVIETNTGANPSAIYPRIMYLPVLEQYFQCYLQHTFHTHAVPTSYLIGAWVINKMRNCADTDRRIYSLCHSLYLEM